MNITQKQKNLLLSCADCGYEFIVTTGEQSFFLSKGWDIPKRCPHCRKVKRDLINFGDKGVSNG